MQPATNAAIATLAPRVPTTLQAPILVPSCIEATKQTRWIQRRPPPPWPPPPPPPPWKPPKLPPPKLPPPCQPPPPPPWCPTEYPPSEELSPLEWPLLGCAACGWKPPADKPGPSEYLKPEYGWLPPPNDDP